MSYNTRGRSTGTTTPSESGEMSQAELEILQKNLIDKEKQIQEQAQALRGKLLELETREENLAREKSAAVDITTLSSILSSLKKDVASLNKLPDQIEQLNQRVSNLQNIEPPISANVSNDSRRPSRQSSPSSPPESSSPIRFKDVVDSIPRYDGHKISVFQFSKICERALHLISSHQEHYLVQLIINKLQGHAYTAIEGTDFETVGELTRQLKKIFGPNKSLNQYRGELGNIYMLPNEDIFTYIDRIKELQTAITDETIRIMGPLDEWTRFGIESDVLESFINGLPSELLVRVKLHGQNNTLDRAIATAIQLSKTLEAETRRKKSTFVVKSSPSPRIDPNSKYNNSLNQYAELRPNNTTSTPSQSPNVPFIKATSFIKPLVPGQPGPNYPEKICRYCKNPGHLINDCRKLAYKRSLLDGSSSSGQERVENNIIPGKEERVPANDGAHRNASPTGRPILAKTVKFQEITNMTPTSSQ